MRFQVVSLPHTQTTREYSNCAFAQLTRRLCAMMTSLGHEVILYSGEDNDAPCNEHVPCISKEEQLTVCGVREPNDILAEPFVYQTYEPGAPWWPLWNERVMAQMRPRARQRDFLCLIGGGVLFEPLISAMPGMIAVEYAVGYAGVAARSHHAFGSSNWQHVVYGLDPPRENGIVTWRGRFYDRVIPHYFDPGEFEYRQEKDDYLLYLGKLKEDKGVLVASRAAEACERRIIFAGQGPTPVPYGEVRNRYIGPAERAELLSGAAAVFVPSLYVEPFGMIAVEALLSGTPIITTPWGGLGEINIHGETGYICHTFRDFVAAVADVKGIEPQECRERGLRYGMDTVRHEYERWFTDLYGLWDGDWSSL